MQTENEIKTKEVDAEKCPVDLLVSGFRVMEKYHGPENCITVQMKNISMLCDVIEEAIPALDLLQEYLLEGAHIVYQDGYWWLFDCNGEGIGYGDSLRQLLVSLIFRAC